MRSLSTDHTTLHIIRNENGRTHDNLTQLPLEISAWFRSYFSALTKCTVGTSLATSSLNSEGTEKCANRMKTSHHLTATSYKQWFLQVLPMSWYSHLWYSVHGQMKISWMKKELASQISFSKSKVHQAIEHFPFANKAHYLNPRKWHSANIKTILQLICFQTLRRRTV